MSQRAVHDFREVWIVDFEFAAPPGEQQKPICVVAQEWHSGRTIRLWEDDLQRCQASPYPTDQDALFVAYYASAELGCHLALGWPLPAYVLDLYVEFRNLTNGLNPPCGSSLLAALLYFGLNGIDAVEKESLRQLALRGGPWTQEERAALLAYCETDVVALAQLLPRMFPHLDLPRALLRGQYMKAAAHMERTGVPIDTRALTRVRHHWFSLQDELIRRIDADYGIYEGRTFKIARWEQWLATRGIVWPRLASGALALDSDTFSDMARIYPEITPMRELRSSLSQLHLQKLAVGADGRNRVLLSAFRASTGRNQPSTSQFIFGPAVWVRGLIRPRPGYGLAYVDWSQQEFGIAAALSGDLAMLAAYTSGDPYLAFGQQAGEIPKGATDRSHKELRDLFKACALAVQYGMEEVSLASRIGQSPAHARELLQLHRHTYPVFWRWSDAALDYALLHRSLHTVFGWQIHTNSNPNPRSLRNFPMQANGAEMLRLACYAAIECGVQVCAPVHDALLIEFPLERCQDAVAITQQAMADASAMVLGGFPLRSEARVVRYPRRYMDKRGKQMWDTVWAIIRGKVS